MSKGRPRPSRHAARVLLWQWIEDTYPEAWDEPDSVILATPEVHRQAVDFLFTHRFLATEDLVAHWLMNADRFSPFIDWIAIKKATELDFEVFLNLSDLEKTKALDIMAAHESFTGKSGRLDLDPKRAAKWNELSEGARRLLATNVSKRRQRLNGVNLT